MQCIENTKSFTTTNSPTLLTLLKANFVSSSLTSGLDQVHYDTVHDFDTSYQESEENVECVWRRSQLSALDFVIYGMVVPFLAIFGFFANFINGIVFMRPKMTPSAFCYLAALSWLDCVSCLLITLTALSRSFLYSSPFWIAYDFQWQTPLFGITTGAANLILACVSLDRFIYLRYGIPNGTPKFCRRIVARYMIIAGILIAVVVNLPYFFVFVVNKDGTFETTEFYFSKYYMIHNWFTFAFLTLLPAIFLLVGNAAILIAFWKWNKQSKKCQKKCPNSKSKNMRNRYKHQMKLTITILIVITLYMVGELPAHLTSRKCAMNLLYGGDVTKLDFKTMERLEVICITLNALQLSMNIMVYGLINPSFMPELFSCLKGASDVCFRYMGFMAIARCCHNCYESSDQTKKKHKNSACEKDVEPEVVHDKEHDLSDIDWQIDDNSTAVMSCKEKSLKHDIEISVICDTSLKLSYDNPSFENDVK